MQDTFDAQGRFVRPDALPAWIQSYHNEQVREAQDWAADVGLAHRSRQGQYNDESIYTSDEIDRNLEHIRAVTEVILADEKVSNTS